MRVQFPTLAALMAVLAAPMAANDSTAVQAIAIVEKQCLQCHGEQTAMSGLRLVGREQILKGGKRGPAVKPGSPSESLLFQAVSRTGRISMPPGGQLDPAEIEVLRVWIEKGAAWPEGSSSPSASSDWWAFHKAKRPDLR